MTASDLIAFEDRIRDRFAAGELPFLVHLSGGNEAQLIDLFRDIGPQDWVFSTHRNHYHALLKGIPPAEVEAAICDGRSMFIFSREHRFFTSSILAGTCAIAAGVAWQLKHSGAPGRVVCFLGDGAEEEGHFYEAALFVEAQGLPCTFIIEDNARQVDTPKNERRGTAFRARYPLDDMACVLRYHYEATYPHAGAGLPPGSVTFKPEIVARFGQTAAG